MAQGRRGLAEQKVSGQWETSQRQGGRVVIPPCALERDRSQVEGEAGGDDAFQMTP